MQWLNHSPKRIIEEVLWWLHEFECASADRTTTQNIIKKSVQLASPLIRDQYDRTKEISYR